MRDTHDSQTHDWITLHRVRFRDPVSAQHLSSAPVTGMSCWRIAPHYQQGETGIASGLADIWGGLGIWHSRAEAEAEAVMAAPQEAMPWPKNAASAWHCLAVPLTHRGAVNWRGHIEDGTAIYPADTDPGGPLVVVTSAGFQHRDTGQLPVRCCSMNVWAGFWIGMARCPRICAGLPLATVMMGAKALH